MGKKQNMYLAIAPTPPAISPATTVQRHVTDVRALSSVEIFVSFQISSRVRALRLLAAVGKQLSYIHLLVCMPVNTLDRFISS